MVSFKKAKMMFTHLNASFQQAYEGATSKARQKAFENNRNLLENWKNQNKNRPLTVSRKTVII